MAALSLAFSVLAKDNASKTFNDVGDSADKAGKKGERFGAAMKAGMAVVAVAAVGLAKSSVSAFVESEQSSNRLNQALKNFPATNDRARASFDALNASLAKKTRFDDDATASGQAVLAQFGLTGAQLQELTPLLQDYAAKTGKDLPSAAEDLGKAVLGQGRALKAVGLDLGDTGTAAGNLEQLMGGLRTQVGGFATAEGQTAAGQAAILGNQFGELQEQIGAKLVPVLTTLAGKLLSTIDFVSRNSAVIVPLVGVLGGFAAAVWAVNAATTASIAVTSAASAVRAFFMTTTIAATGVERASTLSRIAGTIATTASTVAMGIAAAASKAWAATQWLLNAALTANPIGLVVVAIGALVAALVIAYQKSETFREVVSTVFRVVRDAGLDFVSKFLSALGGIFGDLAKIPGPIGDVFKGAAEAVGRAKGSVDALNASLDNVAKVRTVNLNVAEVGRMASAANALARDRGPAGDGPGAGGPMLTRVSAMLPNFPGLSVTSTYRTPARNSAIGGSPTSYHMDRGNPAVDIGGPVPMLRRLYANLRGAPGLRELLGPGDPGHDDHVHVADKGGVFKGPGMVYMGAGQETFASGLAAKKIGDLPPGGGPIDLSDQSLTRLAQLILAGAGSVVTGREAYLAGAREV